MKTMICPNPNCRYEGPPNEEYESLPGFFSYQLSSLLNTGPFLPKDQSTIEYRARELQGEGLGGEALWSRIADEEALSLVISGTVIVDRNGGLTAEITLYDPPARETIGRFSRRGTVDQQFDVVRGLAEEPHVSFLREFSAPVRVRYPRPTDELIFLAEHDPDGFARWDQLQTLLVDEIQRLQRPGTEPSPAVIELFARLADAAIAATSGQNDAGINAMLATLLTLPEEGYLFEMTDQVDVEALCGARDALFNAIACGAGSRWQRLYQACDAPAGFAADAVSMSRRALRNVGLAYLAHALQGAELQELLQSHLTAADNLTDRRAALAQIANADVASDWREQVFAQFLERWQDEALVVNLWFALQASARPTGAAAIERLERHAAFDSRNPNKLRSLYGAFAQQNARNFHARDGSGYSLLAERIIRLNATNPQMAAGLAKPLTRWRRYDAARQLLMQRALAHIAAQEALSKDVYEVVTKGMSASA